MNCVNQKQKITAEQYFKMLNKDELEGDLTAIFGRLRNTEQFWKKPRNDVNCMTQHYGPATWFLTMSPAEWMWDDLGEYVKEVNVPEMANKSISELVHWILSPLLDLLITSLKLCWISSCHPPSRLEK